MNENKVLESAIMEIVRLRQENQILQAKVQTFESCIELMRIQPQYGIVYEGPDVLLELKHEMAIIQRKTGTEKQREADPPSKPII